MLKFIKYSLLLLKLTFKRILFNINTFVFKKIDKFYWWYKSKYISYVNKCNFYVKSEKQRLKDLDGRL